MWHMLGYIHDDKSHQGLLQTQVQNSISSSSFSVNICTADLSFEQRQNFQSNLSHLQYFSVILFFKKKMLESKLFCDSNCCSVLTTCNVQIVTSSFKSQTKMVMWVSLFSGCKGIFKNIAGYICNNMDGARGYYAQ